MSCLRSSSRAVISSAETSVSGSIRARCSRTVSSSVSMVSALLGNGIAGRHHFTQPDLLPSGQGSGVDEEDGHQQARVHDQDGIGSHGAEGDADVDLDRHRQKRRVGHAAGHRGGRDGATARRRARSAHPLPGRWVAPERLRSGSNGIPGSPRRFLAGSGRSPLPRRDPDLPPPGWRSRSAGSITPSKPSMVNA